MPERNRRFEDLLTATISPRSASRSLSSGQRQTPDDYALTRIVSVIDTTAQSIPLIGAATKAKDGAKFNAAYGPLPIACNQCHQTTARGFIEIAVPRKWSRIERFPEN
jgi:hypothetical protein